MANFLQLTPFLHVPDLEEGIRFFTELLGFTVYVKKPDFAYVHRETVGFRLMTRCEEDGPMPARSGFTYYVDIRNMDDLLTELGPKLAGLPPANVYGPVDHSSGQRELMIRTPDRHLLVFGQQISSGLDGARRSGANMLAWKHGSYLR